MAGNVLLPEFEGEEISVFVGRWAGWRVEGPLPFLVGLTGLEHLVVEFGDAVLGAVGAVGGEVLAFDDGEGVEDVADGVAGWGSGT